MSDSITTPEVIARPIAAQSSGPSLGILTILFFLSGASSLIFETIFTRLLTYTFGNTAHAVSTVLAAFLGGLALGAFLFGRWVDKRPASLWVYGTLELLVGLYCLFIPQLFRLLTGAYVALYHQFGLSPGALTVLRFGLAAVVILVPTVLMGGTLPALARFVAATFQESAWRVSRLYAFNTLGAAAGTLSSAYLLMPLLGVQETVWTACAVNFFIFLCVAALAQKFSVQAERGEQAAVKSALANEATPGSESPRALLVAAFLTGAAALAYEVIWTHVLAFLVGTSVYAFGIMLFTFLCGLGLGAHVVSNYFRREAAWTWALAASQIFLGLAVFLTVPLWNRLPDLFALGLNRALELDVLAVAFLLVLRMAAVGAKAYRRRTRGKSFWSQAIELALECALLSALLGLNLEPLKRSETTFFVAGELMRFLASFCLLIIPSLLLGMSFPLLLNLSGRTRERIGANVGRVYAANTLGAILASVLTGFVLLPRFGSLGMIRGAATVNLALGLFFALLWVTLSRTRKIALVGIVSCLAGVLWAGGAGWDPGRMARGSYVYFDRGWPIERVFFFAEDIQGGLTSVVQVGSSRILLSNGKFQGNNSGEISAQVRLALIPILFTQAFDRALVIGLGTGQTLQTVSRFPFERIEAVEIAPRMVEAARGWFGEVNGLVFDRDPRISLSIADGRNFLLLSRERYDLITIEVSSIWISGEADLYNQEFYELCRQHLKEHGVLQQWVQIHHMRRQDFLVLLNTVARVFPNVAFFIGGGQGVLIASASPLECDYRTLARFDAESSVRKELAALRIPSMSYLLGELILYGDSVRQALTFLPLAGGRPSNFISTDFHPYLEYQTPKGNALPYDSVPRNTDFLRGLRSPPLPPDLRMRNLPSEDERNLLLGYIYEAREDFRAALECFEKVEGPTRPRARAEIARIELGVRAGG